MKKRKMSNNILTPRELNVLKIVDEIIKKKGEVNIDIIKFTLNAMNTNNNNISEGELTIILKSLVDDEMITDKITIQVIDEAYDNLLSRNQTPRARTELPPQQAPTRQPIPTNSSVDSGYPGLTPLNDLHFLQQPSHHRQLKTSPGKRTREDFEKKEENTNPASTPRRVAHSLAQIRSTNNLPRSPQFYSRPSSQRNNNSRASGLKELHESLRGTESTLQPPAAVQPPAALCHQAQIQKGGDCRQQINSDMADILKLNWGITELLNQHQQADLPYLANYKIIIHNYRAALISLHQSLLATHNNKPSRHNRRPSNRK